MVTRHRGARTLLGAVLAGSLALTLAACGGDDDGGEKEADASVAATALCGGKAVSARAAEALATITGADRFEASGTTSTVANAAAGITDEGVSTTVGDGDICRIYPTAPDASVDELRVEWRMTSGAPKGPFADEFTLLPMGEATGAAPDQAFVAFACEGGDLPGDTPRHLQAEVGRGGMPVPPDGDEQKLREAYATVAHSFAVSLAKELGCRDAGGLPAKPVLKPA
ncbi:hypothetical protein [Streptomyces genisteinicus]|uniref:DUF3558 domain-containing protein n=1 Tax=Streptomyces genisteinicus TaxID=2768068 RepID=A0A7H0HS94_9ACTN|nr:hypothetical protein [Streptomyces genisteinicus]QNP63410.1 hypothetical protein IAG43_10995 [Streptomyces genisteinicus]